VDKAALRWDVEPKHSQ